MSLISVDPELIMSQLRSVLESAWALAQPKDPGTYSQAAPAAAELLNLCGRLTVCAAACYRALEADVGRAAALLSELQAEDQQMGVMFSNE